MTAGFSIEAGVEGIAKASADFHVTTEVSASHTSSQEDSNTMSVSDT